MDEGYLGASLNSFDEACCLWPVALHLLAIVPPLHQHPDVEVGNTETFVKYVGPVLRKNSITVNATAGANAYS